ncbi:uncharacterized protein C1orf198 homolog [Danaus plexippus]|uniref:Uncharacterized protein n=1 Tax=Danaus plexippus plexippus TaxID=278856 RepID=A0A212EVR1_DANPL|nr:uncharacterized protein C1orf198 homolog [Danaus plexippus]OWR45585.1 hypothetical protein KGM_214414 [Danaus plexippus plexippus]
MALSAVADEYFRTMNPLASKIYEDITETKNAYENIWNTLTEKEKAEIINESIINPDIANKYAILDSLDFDINDPPVQKDNLMSFFGREHGLKIIQDENTSYRDEHSAPFLYQTKSQLNLCILSEHRVTKEVKCTSPPPIMTELALSHSKVVNELKNALKSHDVLKSTYKDKKDDREVSQTGFISKFIGNFKTKDEERECLVPSLPVTQIVASSENFFRTNFKSPSNECKFDKDYRNSVARSSNDLSEENRGLLSSSQASSSDFPSTDTLTETLPKTGYDFLDNW